MKKKIALLLAVALLAMPILAACGAGRGAGSEASDGEISGGEVKSGGAESVPPTPDSASESVPESPFESSPPVGTEIEAETKEGNGEPATETAGNGEALDPPSLKECSSPPSKKELSLFSHIVCYLQPIPPSAAKTSKAVVAYMEVVKNKAKILLPKGFYSANDRELYLNEFWDFEVLRIGNFQVVDMDGDGVPEVLLNRYSDGTLLLRYTEDNVRGYRFASSEMMSVKKDGTFAWKEGTTEKGIRRLDFKGSVYKNIDIAIFLVEFDDTIRGYAESYTICGEQVSADVFACFYNKWETGDDAECYEFSIDNIENTLNDMGRAG